MDERLKLIREKVLEAVNNPDLDVEVCFPEADDACELKPYPYLKVKYVVEGHDVYEKEIDINPDYLLNSDVQEVVNYILFQVQQFMEEIDSVEYGGE
ncbi:hypothetical protein [Thermocrinis minervae]|uniref:Uncharacterized protein n=1 Tax=Thermocrinis minervae TaxID=381751 RepID=A0A1M6SBG8_9AQUI|nr:hypothetical protein [Thermocrinis minervae]SHK41969.1 hypothetical protein SAMN05444391_0958 [Thermocrinis minervae]